MSAEIRGEMDPRAKKLTLRSSITGGRIRVPLANPRRRMVALPSVRQVPFDSPRLLTKAGNAASTADVIDDEIPFLVCDPAHEPCIKRRVVA
jgi:hypothetical protein